MSCFALTSLPRTVTITDRDGDRARWPLRRHTGREGNREAGWLDDFERATYTSYIGTYGDIDTLLAWKYLDADVQVGHEFTFQLVPRLADDVFLRSRVIEKRTVQTDAGTFAEAIAVAYVVDFGISQAVNEDQSNAG